MENISSEVESKDIKINNFFEVIKVIIYSGIGIIIFFIPLMLLLLIQLYSSNIIVNMLAYIIIIFLSIIQLLITHKTQ